MNVKSKVAQLVILMILLAFPPAHAADAPDFPRFGHELGHVYEVFAVTVSPDGQYALSGGTDDVLRLWNLSTGELVRSFPGQSGGIVSVAFSPDGKCALAGSEGFVKLWSMETGKELRMFAGHSGLVGAVMFSPDGKRAVSGDGQVLKVWDLTTGKEPWTFPARSLQRNAFVFCADRESIMAGTEEDHKGYIKIWNTSTGKEMRTDPLPPKYFASAFSPECRRYAVVEGRTWRSAEAPTPMLWDVEKRRLVREFRYKPVHMSFYLYPAFTPDLKYVLSGFDAPVLVLWDVSTGKVVRHLTGHQEEITSAGFFQDGQRAISASIDGSTRLWNVATGKEIAEMVGFLDGEWIVVTPEGYYNASPHGDAEMLVEYDYGGGEPIECFRETFFRPDLVKLALSGGSLANYNKISEVPRPPGATIIDTPSTTDKETVTVVAKVIDKGGGIGDIKLYRNDALVVTDKLKQEEAISAKRGFTLQRAYEVRLDPGSNVIRLVAYNASNSARSTYALHEIKCQAP